MQHVLHPQPGYPFSLRTSIEYALSDLDQRQRFVGSLPPECRRRARLAWYRDGYHMLLRDLEGPVVIADVASWVLTPAAPLPSGADRAAAEAFLLSGSQVSFDAP